MALEIIPLTKQAASGDVDAVRQIMELFASSALSLTEQDQVHILVKQMARDKHTAIYLRAILYSHGYGVVADDDMAYLLMREAASKGNGHAHLWIGNFFLHGKAIVSNPEIAAYWFNLAANDPYYLPEAMYALAQLYEVGKGVEINQAIARAWYERAAAMGISKPSHS